MKSILSLLVVAVFLFMLEEGGAEIAKGTPQKPLTPELKTGDYVWAPEVSPRGPVVLMVSLSEQLIYVYRNGVRIGRSTVSSGKEGHRTPTGVFTILQKNVKHVSTIYKGASMPYMERLTWGGVALHAGNLPGYPAAHGCVRLPLDFAQLLYTITNKGTTVIVTDKKFSVGNTKDPGLLFAFTPNEMLPPGGVVWAPQKAPGGPVSILLSSADNVVYAYRNGVEIGRAPVIGLRAVKGLYVYSALANVDAEGMHEWLSSSSLGGRAPNLKKLVKHISIDQQFLANLRFLIVPGTTVVLTDSPVTTSTHTGPGFDILNTAQTP